MYDAAYISTNHDIISGVYLASSDAHLRIIVSKKDTNKG